MPTTAIHFAQIDFPDKQCNTGFGSVVRRDWLPGPGLPIPAVGRTLCMPSALFQMGLEQPNTGTGISFRIEILSIHARTNPFVNQGMDTSWG